MTTAIPDRILAAYRRAVPDPPPEPRDVLLEQEGEIRLGPDKPWMPFTAEQRGFTTETGFLWHARVKMAPLVTCVVEDAFEDGHGRLDAKVFGLVPVARARGPEVDRGEVQRYLAELPWCPAALVANPALRFREMSDGPIRVWVGDDEDSWVDLAFDGEGDVVAASTTTRARGDQGETQPWEGRFSDYRDFGGIRAPARGEVGWLTPQGPYLYWRGEVTSLGWADSPPGR